MESAIKTLVSVYLKSAKGKDSLGEKDFQNLVKNQLSNIMAVTAVSAQWISLVLNAKLWSKASLRSLLLLG